MNIIATYEPPEIYYRNQILDNRGKWRDVSPEFSSSHFASEAAKELSVREGKTVRVVEFKRET